MPSAALSRPCRWRWRRRRAPRHRGPAERRSDRGTVGRAVEDAERRGPLLRGWLGSSSRSAAARSRHGGVHDGVRRDGWRGRTRRRRSRGTGPPGRVGPAPRRSRPACRWPPRGSRRSPSLERGHQRGDPPTSRSSRSARTTSSRTRDLGIAHQRGERRDRLAPPALAERRGRLLARVGVRALEVGDEVLEGGPRSAAGRDRLPRDRLRRGRGKTHGRPGSIHPHLLVEASRP